MKTGPPLAVAWPNASLIDGLLVNTPHKLINKFVIFFIILIAVVISNKLQIFDAIAFGLRNIYCKTALRKVSLLSRDF